MYNNRKVFVLVLDRFRICLLKYLLLLLYILKSDLLYSHWQKSMTGICYIMRFGTQFSCNHLCSLFDVGQFIVRSSVKLRYKIVLQLWRIYTFLNHYIADSFVLSFLFVDLSIYLHPSFFVFHPSHTHKIPF